MTRKYANYGRCTECDTPLGTRNHTNPDRTVSGLCFICIRKPPDEFRCEYVYPDSHKVTKKQGQRCGLHKVSVSKKGYCGVHKKYIE